MGGTLRSSAIRGVSRVGFRIADNPRDDRHEFVRFEPQVAGFIDGADPTRLVRPEAAMGFADFLQADRAFRDEVGPAFGRPCFFEHRVECRAGIEQLRRHIPGDAAKLVKLRAELDDLTAEPKRPFANIRAR